MRAKAKDVTKDYFHGTTTVGDTITVFISNNKPQKVREDEVVATVGSANAFAEAHQGKLDCFMKLCSNWQRGTCHNQEKCLFAHVLEYKNPLPLANDEFQNGAVTTELSGGKAAAGRPQGQANLTGGKWPQGADTPPLAPAAFPCGAPHPIEEGAQLTDGMRDKIVWDSTYRKEWHSGFPAPVGLELRRSSDRTMEEIASRLDDMMKDASGTTSLRAPKPPPIEVPAMRLPTYADGQLRIFSLMKALTAQE